MAPPPQPPPPPPPPQPPPECPICLEPYNTTTTIPRVLPCGHTTCQLCLSLLPNPHPHPSLIRCPSCTQLLKLPHPQGPSALPKNIDLLHYSSPPQPHLKTPQNPTKRRRFPPPHISSPHIYSSWKHWLLPHTFLHLGFPNHHKKLCLHSGFSDLGFPKSPVLDDQKLGFSQIGTIRVDLGFSDLGLCGVVECRLVDDQKVVLVEIGRFEVDEEESFFEYSYVSKVMRVLGCMSDAQRLELGALLGVSLRQVRVCNALGVWLDVESGLLYLVTERKQLDGVSSLGGLEGADNEGGVCFWSMIGGELCEALVSLRLEGFVCGCLSMCCLCLDEFGHVYVDLGEVLLVGRKIRECVLEGVKSRKRMDGSGFVELVLCLSKMDVFISPEVFSGLLGIEGIEMESNDVNSNVDYSSDVWLVACVLLRLLIGEQFSEGMYCYLRAVFEAKKEEVCDWKIVYMQWVETVNASMETLRGSNVDSSLRELLVKCLDLDPSSRPLITDVWKNIRGSSARYCNIHPDTLKRLSMKDSSVQCLVFGELCNVSNGLRQEPTISGLDGSSEDCEAASSRIAEMTVNDVVEGMSAGKVHCKDLQGHMDCVTSLCVGGGFLFSSSFDKTINVWSLQDFRHVHTFRGHEHKVMALVFVDQEKPLCISADNGGGIFSWEVVAPFSEEPLKKWYEQKDWRYSGIHALAISESGCLYTGSGDRLIKAWSLKDYSLLCSMEGHKSVVSALALYNGVLYSGSWDGTVRLWCLHDHSPLTVFGEGMPGSVSSVLSIHADQDKVIAAHENGCIKIWVNGELKASVQVHNGAIFALSKEEKWVFTGGWDRSVKVQEISGEGLDMDTRELGSLACDSVVTALLYEGGMLFVGYANKLIKVYHC